MFIASLLFTFLFFVNNTSARNDASKDNRSMVGFSFYRPNKQDRTATVVNSGPNELNKWCPPAIRRDLQPHCLCNGPYVFPVISCQQLNNEREVRRMKTIKFPITNIGKFRFNDSIVTRFDTFNMPIKMAIQFIEIEKTRITEIDLKAFDASSDTLVRLTVVHSNLSKFPFSYLKNFKRLQYLDLFYNQLTQIHDFAFGSNSILTHIDLSFNSISYIGSYAFYDLPNLKHLDLRFNKIKVLNNNAFTSRFPKYDLNDGLSLDISHNKMFFIADDAFSRTTFKKIDISHNVLKKFGYTQFEPIIRTMITVGKGMIQVEGKHSANLTNLANTNKTIHSNKLHKNYIT
ncbi:oplophorus-luciferin 2-monooxygenase non-catalytic subunit-like protein [Leptotrombidium deliense]|uniref:Oplophorus-luciferin 2-monooxygenase non-catalytic subunit-like protein n=1 Tax=Leptotrombidium deliense TaxID=299467 RepID=A0A443S417_9ACAR|nr:oplophorus-luciferin 2-monooxygenase non-catalytic subunit-like protein [Leptotrombidium deliense]